MQECIPVKLPALSGQLIQEMARCKWLFPCPRHHHHLVLCRHVEPYYRSPDCDRARAERKWALDNPGHPFIVILPPEAGLAGRWAQDYGKLPILQVPPHPDFTGWVGHYHPHLSRLKIRSQYDEILFSNE